MKAVFTDWTFPDLEPIPAGHPLLRMTNVLLTPHVASCSPTAVGKLRQTVARLAAAVLAGQPPDNVVNGVASLGLSPGKPLAAT